MSEEVAHYALVHSILSGARELHGEELEIYLRGACDGDASLRRRVLELLSAGRDDARRDALSDEGLARARIALEGILEADASGDPCPRELGPYRILRRIGAGGMGSVYEAEQAQPRRRVALKVVHSPFASPEVRQRFRHEVEVLGYLRHPGLAQLYAAGTAETGQGSLPYFAMELVEGPSLREYVGACRPGSRALLELLIRICDALHHAHQKGVIHRDLKPANILVAGAGASPPCSAPVQPKILDFGVARVTGVELGEATLQTREGLVVGTLAYMSPEQARGCSSAVDVRSDIYSLGVIAYELLSGRLPHELEELPLHEAVRVISEEEPRPLGTLVRALRGDVEAIVAKAISKDPDRRYSSAAELAADLRRFLDDEPVLAVRPRPGYQALKFWRRNRLAVSAGAAILVLLVGGLTGTSWGLVSAIRAREAEATARAEAQARSRELERVAGFQSAQLADIRADSMGLRLRQDLLEEIAAALVRAEIPAPERAARRAAVDQALAAVNFTDIALRSLTESVFSPTLAAIDEEFEDQPRLQARLLQTLATTLLEVGLLDAATEPQSRALALRRRELGDEHPETLASIDAMGFLLQSQGRLEDAEELFREVLEVHRRNRDGEGLMSSTGRLGFLLQCQGDLEEGEPLLRETLRLRRRILGEDHPDTLEWMGGERWREARFAEVVPCWRQSLAARRRLQGADHPRTVNTMNNLAIALERIGSLTGAEALWSEVLATRRRLFGAEHPKTLESMGDLGELLVRMGRTSDARALYRERLEVVRRVHGDEHPQTAVARAALEELEGSGGPPGEPSTGLRLATGAQGPGRER